MNEDSKMICPENCPNCGEPLLGNMPYGCVKCGKDCCSACTENDPKDCYRVICDECNPEEG